MDSEKEWRGERRKKGNNKGKEVGIREEIEVKRRKKERNRGKEERSREGMEVE